jgi:hypothetical protein
MVPSTLIVRGKRGMRTFRPLRGPAHGLSSSPARSQSAHRPALKVGRTRRAGIRRPLVERFHVKHGAMTLPRRYFDTYGRLGIHWLIHIGSGTDTRSPQSYPQSVSTEACQKLADLTQHLGHDTAASARPSPLRLPFVRTAEGPRGRRRPAWGPIYGVSALEFGRFRSTFDAGGSHDESTGSRENWFAMPRRRAAVAARRCTGQEMAEEQSSEGQIVERAATIPSCYPQRYPQPDVAKLASDHRDIHSGSPEHPRSQQRRFRRGGADGSVRSARRASPFGRMHSVMSPPTLPSAR